MEKRWIIVVFTSATSFCLLIFLSVASRPTKKNTIRVYFQNYLAESWDNLNFEPFRKKASKEISPLEFSFVLRKARFGEFFISNSTRVIEEGEKRKTPNAGLTKHRKHTQPVESKSPFSCHSSPSYTRFSCNEQFGNFPSGTGILTYSDLICENTLDYSQSHDMRAHTERLLSWCEN